MRKLLVGLLPVLLLAANFKLYLKDGNWHVAREYKVEGDRVRFYSVERSEWEEIPVELTDLKRTEAEIKEHAEARKEQTRLIDEEEKAERAAAREISNVPQDPGVYYVDGKDIRALKPAEAKMNSKNRKRSILKIITPIPVITDKSTLEIDGETSAFTVKSSTPEFYFRLSAPERFTIIRLGMNKGNRVVEKVDVIPVSKEIVETREEVEIFRRQVGDQLYKIWPMAPLPPGEYAAIEYTEGKVNAQIFDFSVK
ncbi:MAG: hypothetical protein IANPNBLG_03159 [Bryobacteraceae bacterium]|nr:hypothetical protein [Bryobacteraceae bacterium]MCC6344740.1 hypothetical protein [Bryobacterales bacterium]